MKSPSNASNKKKVVETAGSAQALQVVPRTPLAPASGTIVLGPPMPTDPLIEPPRHCTSSNTSVGAHHPQKVNPAPK
ncbi:UNVERIFIED_CONTAM: hypothetical protein Slati_0773200 [Sesamum latifolium]|uniref:Uncharacterized protein n=1 Tax=Sesamum latifolium TaxID=2727402 RepID=A0AAW2XKZ2_9LAMI